MDYPEISDPRFRAALRAIDAGDLAALEALLAEHPELVRARLQAGEGYFRHPFLLWFLAENPIRTGKLAANVAELGAAIVRVAQREGVDSLQEQLDYTLALVCSGRVPRESGVQDALIDLLAGAGADVDGAMLPALAHRELAAAERLLQLGATLTLIAAICMGRPADVIRLARAASAQQWQDALTAAAFYGQPVAIAMLVDLGVDLDAYSPAGFHPHGTALHHSVDSGSLAAVKVLVEAGANLHTRDLVHRGTALEWAEYLKRTEIAAYLRQREEDEEPSG